MTAPLTAERLAGIRARNDRLLPNIDLQCPVEVADESGHLEPCGKVSSTWRWYDGDDHEPMLMACCYGHETNGAEELAAVLADAVPDLIAEVERLTERAERAEGALQRVRHVLHEWTDGDDGPFEPTLTEAIEENGAWRFARDLREAMEGKP